MKRFPKSAASCWLLLGIGLIVTGVAGADTAKTPRANWTLMVYLDADNDLERPMMRNLAEMAKVGSTDAVNVIVLAARSPRGDGKYTNEAVVNLPNWTTVKLLRVEPNRLRELADWGAEDMGDPATLARFLRTATQDFPADHYGLIIGDHGMAWAGAAVAESKDFDSLAVDDFSGALKDVTTAVGRFDLIGFDACVMANLEVAKTLAPFARYLVASEEIEPADGWDYAPLLRKLTASPTMDGAQLGRVIVDTFHDYFANGQRHELREKAKAITLAVVDLDRVAQVADAVANLGSGANKLLTAGGHDAWVHIAHARGASEEYGRTGALTGAAPPGSETYDLVHVAENIKANAHDTASAAAADAVIASVRQAVIYSVHGDARPRASGLAIFFPPDQATLTVRGKTSYNETGFAQRNRWYPFLAAYTAFPASAKERNRPKPSIDPLAASGRMASPQSPINIVSQVHGDDVEDASFVLSNLQGGERILMGAIPVDLDAAGDLKEEWDGAWFTITDQHIEFIAPITSFEELSNEGGEDVYWAEVPAQVRLNGTNAWLNVTLTFLLDFRGEEVTGDYVYAVEYSAHGPREIDIDEGDDLRPVYEVIDAAGKARLEVEPGDHVMHIHDIDDLKVERSAVPPGRYQVGFEVRDLEGRHSERFVEVEVQ